MRVLMVEDAADLAEAVARSQPRPAPRRSPCPDLSTRRRRGHACLKFQVPPETPKHWVSRHHCARRPGLQAMHRPGRTGSLPALFFRAPGRGQPLSGRSPQEPARLRAQRKQGPPQGTGQPCGQSRNRLPSLPGPCPACRPRGMPFPQVPPVFPWQKPCRPPPSGRSLERGTEAANSFAGACPATPADSRIASTFPNGSRPEAALARPVR